MTVSLTRPAPSARALATAALLAIALALFASCAALTQPAPDKATFAIDPGPPGAPSAPSLSPRPPAAAPVPTADVLRVRQLRVASPYDTTSFVYRTGQGGYRTDYYNGFVAAPDRLLTGALVQWLSRAGPFDAVVDTASGVRARYVLDGNVTALYGDYADKAAPTAVLTLRVFLFDDAAAESPGLLFQKEYHAAAPITTGSAASLVRGWDEAYRSILEQLTADLRARRSSTAGHGRPGIPAGKVVTETAALP